MITKINPYETEAPEEFKETETLLKNQPLKTPVKIIHFSPAAAKSEHLRLRLATAKPLLRPQLYNQPDGRWGWTVR